MKIYLKIINPALAFLVLLLCLWSASFHDGKFEIFGLVAGGMGTYFFAKGIFSSSVLIILGKILLEIRAHRNTSDNDSKIEMKYIFLLLIMAIGMLYAVLMFGKVDKEQKNKYVRVYEPEKIVILEKYIVRESEDLRITGKLKNNSDVDYDSIKLSADVRIGGRYSDTCTGSTKKICVGEGQYFIIKCDDLKNKNITEDIQFELNIDWATKEK